MHVRHARPPAVRSPWLLPLLLVALGCAAPSADETAASARSWTATLRLAIADRQAGAITARYTDQLRERAGDALGALRAATRQTAASRAATDSLAAVLATVDTRSARR